MATPTPFLQKFLATAACAPWPTLNGAQFPAIAFGDVDGDGRDEPLILVPDPNGMLPPALGVLSLFDYAAVEPGWSGVTPDQQLVGTGLLPVQQPIAGGGYPGTVLRSAALVTVGFDSVLFYDGVGTLTTWQWGAMTGYTPTAQGGTIAPGEGSDAGWTMGANQFFLTGDIDGDGLAEVIAYDGNATLGILKWSAAANNGSGGLVCLGTQAAFTQVGSSEDWSFSAGTVFWIGDLNGDNQAELLALTPGQELAVLSWANPGLQVLGVVTGTVPNQTDGGAAWSLNGPQQIAFADLDGDGMQELVVFTVRDYGLFSVSLLGVLGWSGTALEVLGTPASQLTGVANWSMAWGQTFFAGVFEAGQGAAISLFDAQVGAALVTWTLDGGFSVAALATGSVPAGQAGGASWAFGGDNVLAFADVDGDGALELVVASSSAGAVGALQWASGALTTLATTVPVGNNAAPCQSWGMGLVYNAPVTAFTAFTGDQAAIYQQLNSSINPTVQLTGGIRAAYLVSANKDGTFSSWQTQISGNLPGSKSGTWPWVQHYAPADVAAVFNPIINELGAVAVLYGVSDNIYTLLNEGLYNQRISDLGTVLANLVVTPPPAQNVSYWPGQIVVGLLWGVAALGGAGDVLLGAGLSAVASLAGSVLAAPQGTPGALPAPTVVEYSELASQSANDANTANAAIADQFTVLRQDPVKLALLSNLMEGAWPISDVSTVANVAAASAYNRFYYYQMLMPAVFQWTKWAMTSASAPWILQAPGFEDSYFSEKPLTVNGVVPPFWPDQGSLYMWRAFNTSVEDPGLPAATLVTDLFTNLTLTPADLINNQRGWGFQTNWYSIGDDLGTYNNGNVVHFYMTNSADVPVWYTISVFGSNQEWGWIQPGQVLQSQQIYDTTQPEVKVRGQYNGWTGKRWDTRIEVSKNAGLVAEGATSSVGNWFTYVAGSDNVYWVCDNAG